MNDMDILELALYNQQTAWKILEHTGIIPAWERIGATVHLVGSLKSGLLAKSRDIDLSLFSFLQRIMQASAMKACFQIASAAYFLRKDIKKSPLAQIIRG